MNRSQETHRVRVTAPAAAGLPALDLVVATCDSPSRASWIALRLLEAIADDPNGQHAGVDFSAFADPLVVVERVITETRSEQVSRMDPLARLS